MRPWPLLLLIGCASGTPEAQPPPTTVTVEPTRAATNAPRTVEPAPAPEPPPPVEVAGTDLGDPCEQGAERCGTRGRIAIWHNPDESPAAPPEPVPCKLQQMSEPENGYEELACLDEGVLYAVRVCLVCRMLGAGSRTIALVDEMRRSQHAAVRKRLRITEATPDDRSSWRAVIEEAAKAHASDAPPSPPLYR